MSIVAYNPRGEREENTENAFDKFKRYAETMQIVRGMNRSEHEAIELDRKVSKVLCCFLVLFLAIFPGIIVVTFTFGSVKDVMSSSVSEKILATILFCIAYGVTTYILIKRWFSEIDRKALVDGVTLDNKAITRLTRESETKRGCGIKDTANKEKRSDCIGLKAAALTVGGMVVSLVFMIYHFLPLAGALAFVVGLVGFFTGADFALRTFVAGLAMLAVKPIVGAIFMKLLDRKPAPQSPPPADKSFTHGDGSVTIVHDDGSASMHTADGKWISFASPKPSQLDSLYRSAIRPE